MTNFDKWQLYCKDFKSPNLFIEFGFYFMIAASLQRKVWRGSERKPLFPNMYGILVGEPGVGKGLVLEEVEKIFKHPMLRMREEDMAKDLLFGTLYKAKQKGNAVIEMPSLVQLGPRSVGFEFMVYEMASNTRSFKHGPPEKIQWYVHSSICFILMEMSSLFRKHMEDLMNYLLETYDCGDYERKTFAREDEKIKNCCMNIIAGTTPAFIKKAFNQDIFDQGLSSRFTFVYAMCNRFNRCKPPEFDEEQIKAHLDIVTHVKSLTGLFGEVKFTTEAEAYLEHWSDKIKDVKRVNHSPKLKGYYARKDVTVQKLAMAMHFAESTEMLVGIEECYRAIEALERIEKQMHICFTGEDKNPIADVTEGILNFIRTNGETSRQILWIQFYRDLPAGKKSLDEALEFLMATGQVKVDGNKFKLKQ